MCTKTRYCCLAVSTIVVGLLLGCAEPASNPPDAKATAVQFLAHFGETGTVTKTEIDDRTSSQYPSIDVAVTFENGQTYFVHLDATGQDVKGARGETRTDARKARNDRAGDTLLKNGEEALAYLHSLRSDLFGPLEVSIDDLAFSPDKYEDGKLVEPGRVTASLTRRYNGLAFLDRVVRAGVEIDPYDKGLVTYTAMKEAPPVADLTVAISRQQAEQAWADHSGEPAARLADCTAVMGLAVRPGESVARPTWAFKRGDSAEVVAFVDCKTKRVFRPEE